VSDIDSKALRQPNETPKAYRIRLYKNKDVYGLNNIEIGKLCNEAFGVNWDESAHRKKTKEYLHGYNDAKDELGASDLQVQNMIEENKLLLQEVKKEKQKLSDERVEFNRQIRQEARKESYADLVKRIICEDVEPINIPVHYTLFNGTTDLLCHLSDIHTGIEINNWKNVFNEDVLKRRIEKYTSDILDIRGLHQSQDCYLVIGEILSGLIHNNLRLQNNMDLMEQFKYVSELISAMLVRLAYNFNHVYVYTTPGNHSRVVARKEDALDGENMDVLLPFYLKAKMQNIDNISILDNTIEPEIAMFNIRGNNVFSAHGHKDSPATVVQNFTMMFGIKPNIVLLGHRHTNGLTTVYDTKVIESGCVSGSDDYAVSIRKTNKPEQTVSVIGDKGLICLYDIQLDA
jgi:hypothetical protein